MGVMGGIYSGLRYTHVPLSDYGTMDTILQGLIDLNRADDVVSIFMYPEGALPDGSGVKNMGMNYFYRPSNVDGYTPRNKKLLTYPYVFLNISSPTQSKDFRYELGNYQATGPDGITTITFASLSPTPEIVCYVMGYNGSVQGGYQIEPENSVSLTGFPQCAFTIDSYRAYIAQHGVSSLVNLGTQMGAAAMNLGMGNLPGGIISAVGAAASLQNMITSATGASTVKGNQGTSTHVATKTMGIYFKRMTIRASYAMMIDDYFDRYGYSICRVKVPNRNVRPHWCYTKTKNVSIKGNLPAPALEQLQNIYDNGITFWKKGSELGNYSLNNQV